MQYYLFVHALGQRFVQQLKAKQQAAELRKMATRRFYLPGDVALSPEAQDLLARIFTPDPAKRIGLAAMRVHPWLRGARPLLSAPVVDDRAAPRSATAAARDAAADSLQSVESIVQVCACMHSPPPAARACVSSPPGLASSLADWGRCMAATFVLGQSA